MPEILAQPETRFLERLETPEGPTLRFVDDERSLWIHSPRAPRREAVRIADTLKLNGDELLVILGGGLGYLPREVLTRHPRQQVVVLEPRRDPLLSADGSWRVIAGSRVEDAVALLTRWQLEARLPDLILQINPAYAERFPRYTSKLLQHWRKGRNVPTLRLNLRKTSSLERVLILDGGYFLQRELQEGWSKLGVKTAQVKVSSQEHRLSRRGKKSGFRARDSFLKELLETCSAFRPQLLLTVNHLGFDRSGRLTELLNRLRLPVAAWYVDSPTYILNGEAEAVDRDHFLFVWERTYMKSLQQMGFHRVCHLPLAASTHFLTVRKGRGSGRRPVAFVGGSNERALTVWAEKCGRRLPPEKETAIVEQQAANPRVPMEHLLAEQVPDWSDVDRRALESLLVLRATQLARRRLLKEVEADIYGDRHWADIFPGRRCFPGVDYYQGLPEIYGAYNIQLNQTSFQMNTTVNQRVFDVPLGGGLPLTDYREDLEKMFRLSGELREAVVYHDPREARELVAYFRKREWERRKIVVRATERILREHLYQHRLQEMKQIIESHWREKE